MLSLLKGGGGETDACAQLKIGLLAVLNSAGSCGIVSPGLRNCADSGVGCFY